MDETQNTQQVQAVQPQAAPLSASDLQKQVNTIHNIMRSVMLKDVHYGTIPGTGKPSLWKPGAEKILMTFHIASRISVEDLSTEDEARYRVKTELFDRKSGTFLGAGYGEASSFEEKYRWQAALCDEQFEMVPEDQRRIKFQKKYKSSEIEKIKQIATSKADKANTVLKMAEKRSFIGATLKVTAASDIFEQGEYEESGESQGTAEPTTTQKKASVKQPTEKKEASNSGDKEIVGKCSQCSAGVTQNVLDYSNKQYGKALCFKCQKGGK